MQPQKRTLWAVFLMLLLGILLVPAQAQQATFASPKLVVNTSFLNVRTGPSVEYSILTIVVGGTELPVLGLAKDKVWYQVNTVAGVGWVNVEFTLARGEFANVPFVEAPPLVTTTITLGGVPSLGQGGGGVAPTISTAPVSSGSIPPAPVGGRTTTTGVSLQSGNMFEQADHRSKLLRGGLVTDPNTIYPVQDAKTVGGVFWAKITISGIGTGWVPNMPVRILRCSPSDIIIELTRDVGDLKQWEEGWAGVTSGSNIEIILRGDIRRTVPLDAVRLRPANSVSICDGVSFSAGDTTVAGSPTNPGQGGGAIAPTIAGNRIVVNTPNLNIRSGPGGNYTAIAQVTGGTTLAIVGRAGDDEWFLVQGFFGLGWVDSEFVIFRGTYSTVPLIEDAYSGGGIIIQPSTTTTVNANLGQGGGGVAPVAVTATNRVIVNTGTLNVRSGPNGSFSIITSVVGGTELPILGRTADSSWFFVQVGAVQGWVDSEFVIFRGNFDTVPLVNG